MGVKSAIKKLVPQSLLEWRGRSAAARKQREYAGRSVADTFSDIYKNNLWGGETGEFYSGTGSDDTFGIPYARLIAKFLADNNVKSVTDLGCGDFRVASKFVTGDITYTGCDVVPSLVKSLNAKNALDNVSFRTVNIVDDDLPDADLCLIRQVLQHLSNAEIAQALQKCEKYKYLIVTEHYPKPNDRIIPNLDVDHGPGTRLYHNSAVFLDQPPFNLQNTELLMEMTAEENTVIKTFLIRNNS